MPGFKAKTIKSVISKKINDWISTIEDEGLRKKSGEEHHCHRRMYRIHASRRTGQRF